MVNDVNGTLLFLTLHKLHSAFYPIACAIPILAKRTFFTLFFEPKKQWSTQRPANNSRSGMGVNLWGVNPLYLHPVK
jgi:hypothetical protein